MANVILAAVGTLLLAVSPLVTSSVSEGHARVGRYLLNGLGAICLFGAWS